MRIKGILFKLTAAVLTSFIAVCPQLQASVPIDCDLVIENEHQSSSERDIYKLAYCNIKKENYGEGAALFESIMEKLPLLSDYIIYYRAFSHHKLGNNNGAVDLYNELLKNYPQSTLKKRVSESLAEIYFQNKEFAKAEQLYLKLYSSEKDHKKKPEYLFGVANSLKGQKRYQEAIDKYKDIWVRYPTSGYSKLSNQQAIKIAGDKNLVFKITPNDYFSRAQKFYVASHWKSALRNYSKSPQTQAVKVNSAICHFRIGAYTNALSILDGINSSKSLFWQAQIRSKQNLNGLSAKIYLQLVKNHPNSHFAPQALFNAAKLHEIDKKLDDAITVYEMLIKNYPRTEYAEDASWNLGWIYYKKKEYLKAHNTFTGFINSGSSFNSTRSEYWSARTMEKLGNKKQADYIYKRLSGKFFPSYYPYLAQIKSGYDDKSKIKNEQLQTENSDSSRKVKAMFLIELGILEDALLEINYLNKSAKSVNDYIDLSILYGKANDFYNAIKVVQGI
ncbi:MAG: tetratricopeptide repeat protein, partial [Candidatus Dadabacteria bacterium]|nr:tetratricopeptide repeat protein [Candidatus Dadabacteria bacterium]NIT12889.1 tetratricopeptide repeat protein [Candidatus Dadabacteria bacterium]